MLSNYFPTAILIAACGIASSIACGGCSASGLEHPSNLYGRALNTNSAAESLVQEAIHALGGRKALESLQGVIYSSPEILRVSTVMQNYNLFHTDRYVVSHGTQNISYSFSNTMAQRIDRDYQLSDYFVFGNPAIPPAHFSLVMKDGSQGYACYVEGNDYAFLSANVSGGYTDSALAEYLLYQAQKMSPRLLLDIHGHNLSKTELTINEVKLPAVHDNQLDLTVAFDPDTKLPFIIRSFEDHAILGRTENDLRLFNYTEIDGLKFPTQRLTIQNDTSVLEQISFDRITPNPEFPKGFFDGLANGESVTPRVAPSQIEGYSHAEIGEYWSNALWGGPYTGTYDKVTTETLGDDLPNAYRLLVENSPNLEHLILDFEDGVIVYEAPPHQTDLVIRWVKEYLKKPITHIYATHHHHDHNYDIRKYVALGAKIIAPEVGARYWQQIPGAEVVTFTEDKSFIYSDSKMQARFIWHPEAPHALDWTYSIVTTKCPNANSTMLAYVADVFSTSVPFDTHFAWGWLEHAVADGMSRNTTVVPAHGKPVPLSLLLDEISYVYPELDSTGVHLGGASCLSG